MGYGPLPLLMEHTWKREDLEKWCKNQHLQSFKSSPCVIRWWLVLESCLNTFKDLLLVIFLCKDKSVIRIGNSKRISYRNYEFWMSFHGRPLRINTVSDSILYSFVFYLTVLEKQLYLYLERCWQNVISHLQKYLKKNKNFFVQNDPLFDKWRLFGPNLESMIPFTMKLNW